MSERNKDIFSNRSLHKQPKNKCRINNKLKLTMLITIAIGVVATILFVLIFDIANRNDNFDLLIYLIGGHWFFYALEYFVIYYCFNRKFGKREARWVATLSFSPILIEIMAAIILSQIQLDCMMIFIKWYAMIGITISALIFEYKYFTFKES